MLNCFQAAAAGGKGADAIAMAKLSKQVRSIHSLLA
jgi:hypothetical protein